MSSTGQGTTTLTDFLLARIAEDDATACDVIKERIRIGEVIDYPAEGEDRSLWADFDGASPSVSVGGHRMRAECKAKRTIVEAHCCEHPAWRGDCPTLRALALPYADHPDYREEWRP